MRVEDITGRAKKALPYVFTGLIGTNLGEAIRISEGTNASEKILSFMQVFPEAFKNFLPSFHPFDLLIGAAVAGIFALIIQVKRMDAKKYRQGVEYGSARWGTRKDIQPFINPDFQQNVILTATESLTMENRPKNPKYARNKNCLIIGGSGSGKTRFWLKPNLLQMHSSYVITDPKGEILLSCGNALLKNGYQIRVLNTINFSKSMKYNPFAYLHSEKDILKLVTALIANTKGEGKAGDEFWTKAETLLYTALIGYIHYEAPEEEQNFNTLLEMLNSMEVREDDEDFENAVDIMFKKLEKRDPDHFAVRQYKKFKMAAGKTLKSILISCGARLAPFDIKELREITAYDELAIDTIGDRKTALFLIMSDTDSTFNFLISMVYTQMFNLLCEKADDYYGGRLPVHVRCLIDEMANIGQIPNLEKLVATIRSREISACLVLQAQSQLKAIYKDNADTIIGNMDSRIFLGGTEPTTLKELSEALGKETIDLYNTGESRGRETSHSLNYQKTGKELVRIQIPNADPNDHDPWQEFVLGTNQVHENQYGKGLWAKIPAEGHTKVSRPFLAGQDENGRNIWKREMRTVSNRELKEMVEFYKTRGRDERTSSSADRQAQEKTGPDRESASQKAEPESEKASGKAPPGDRSSVKEQLEAGRKEAEKTKSPKAKTGKKQNKEPEL